MNNYTHVRQNRVSKKRNVIGLYNSKRSISLNQLNTEYVDQFYKEQYLLLKEQHEQAKRQLNKQQEQLKQLNYKLQRLLQEKKDFLSQFVHYSQVNTGYLVQDLEMANLRLEKENKKLRDQLLLAQVRAASANKNQLGKVMIINMKQQLQTNYGWVKPRIDSGLNDRTKRNPLSGQLVRQRKMVSMLTRSDKRYPLNRSINKNKLTIRTALNNKERNRRVSFSNQLEQEHLYEDDFEQEEDEEAEIMEDEDWTLESSDNDEESNKFKSNDEAIIDSRLDSIDNEINKIESSDEENTKEEEEGEIKMQLNKARNKIKKLEEIVYLQQEFIDKQQELANQNDHLDSLKQDKENWFNKDRFQKSNSNKNFETLNLISTNLDSSSLESSLNEIESIETAGGNEVQLTNQVSNDKNILNNVSNQLETRTVSTNSELNEFDKIRKDQSTNYQDNEKKKESKSSKKNERLFDENNKVVKKIESQLTNSSIFANDEVNSQSSSSSSLDRKIALSVLHKGNRNDELGNENGFTDQRAVRTPIKDELVENLTKQLQIEKVKNGQLESKNRGRLRELEQNINELSRENEILRNSLEKCIQDCLNEIGGSGL